METVGFIGAGRIARIMIEGWSRAGKLPHRIVVYDIDTTKRRRAGGGLCRRSSVRPGHHGGAGCRHCRRASAGRGRGAAGAVAAPAPGCHPVVAGAETALCQLTDMLGGFTRIARQNPNAPSILGHGYNPIAYADGLDADGRRALIDLLRPLGECPEVAEETIEAYALISAMGPTYLWFQLGLLRSLGVQFGLSETAARQAVAKMAHGAVSTLLESDLPPEQVLDLVPVKPLAGDEAAIAAIYRSRLEPLYAKLTA